MDDEFASPWTDETFRPSATIENQQQQQQPFPAPLSPPPFPNTTASSSTAANLDIFAPAPVAPETATPICRICRGEATAAEPLFYPCKCSGSIKYVHQECLMEWLSHSQKKYCELCKTSFRFTKLYAPDMPQSLPTLVFVQHMAKHLFRNVLVWLRAVLTVSIWIGWLPYFMRAVWSFMFWISNEGLGASSLAKTKAQNDSMWLSIAMTSGECPVTPLQPKTMTMKTEVDSMMKVLDGESFPQHFVKLVLGSLGMPVKVNGSDVPTDWVLSSDLPALLDESNKGVGSLLSDVTFLRNLTRSPTINRIIISVIEGQIITILVIICFILVILVRDYVIQQQPEMNARAGEVDVDVDVAAAAQAAQELVVPIDHEAHHQDAQDFAAGNDGPAIEANIDQEPAVLAGHLDDDFQEQDQQQHHHMVAPSNDSLAFSQHNRLGGNNNYSPNHRTWRRTLEGPDEELRFVPMEVITSLARQHQIDQGLAPGWAGAGAGQSTVLEYIRIYQQAKGHGETILQIIQDEGLEDEMEYWVKVTLDILKTNALARGREIFPYNSGGESSTGMATPRAENSDSEALRRAPEVTEFLRRQNLGMYRQPSQAENKGKETSWHPMSPSLTPRPQSPGQDITMRPRAASAGPSGQSSAHPLASNSWSFAALPTTTTATDDSSIASSTSDDAFDFDDLHLDYEEDPLLTAALNANVVNPFDDSNSDARIAELLEQRYGRKDDGRNVPFDESYSNEPADFNGLNNEQEELAPAQQPVTAEADTDPTALAEVAIHPPEPIPIAANGVGGGGVGVFERLANFMWGDLDNEDEVFNAEEIEAVHAELDEPWVDLPIAPAAGNEEEADLEDDADEDEAIDGGAAPEGFDQEAIEDMEDFEGVMELIGMRGPIAGLFQNSIFCAVLVSVTIFACIFVPYNIGRITLWVVANPARLVRILIEISKIIQDSVIMVVSITSWMGLNLIDLGLNLIGKGLTANGVETRVALWDIWRNASSRVFSSAFLDLPISTTEIQNFSAVSHHALFTVKNLLMLGIVEATNSIQHIFSAYIRHPGLHTLTGIPVLVHKVFRAGVWIAKWPLTPELWLDDLGETENLVLFNPDLAQWSALDRFWAIMAGYITLFAIGAMYLNRESGFGRRGARGWEAGVVDTLNQASGIMKVILIISIEMLVFPLYCGLLLDVALLPLFEDATVASRAAFTYNYPLTSVFVHWFVGTGYMFHFALFVSMCRKIMRAGVLYFIRDPDDPEFHPVREVLQKNLTTQLRKILFSAFIYGALVVICLGGVVWGLALTLPTVLPIHYSSNEPVLEFPVDLLFYNFLMPLAVKFFKPSDGIHAMYTWWFRKCARGLRLTYFLFGERKIDEEGILQLPEDSPYKQTLYGKYFVELDESNQVIPKTWKDTFEGGGDVKAAAAPLSKMQRTALELSKVHLVSSGQLIKDGDFVRAPASDRVKVQKGIRVFLPVSESNRRSDSDIDDDLYSTDQFQFVYIPPNFRTRIFSFILFIWLFAAVTGVSLTVIPLVFGRMIFKTLIPDHVRTNDIYAFSIGIYLLGSAAYVVLRFRKVADKLQTWLRRVQRELASDGAIARVARMVLHVAKLVYTYSILLIAFPLLLSGLAEAYFMIPLHTYMNPPTVASIQGQPGGQAQEGKHSVHITQSWVLGLLYLKLATSTITTMLPGTRLAAAVQRVMRRGWLYPDVGVFTRAFAVVGITISVIGLVGPPITAGLLIKYDWFGLGGEYVAGVEGQARVIMIHRYSYPVAALIAFMIKNAFTLARVVESLTVGIRDEAYLIGERLHNFGAATAGAKKTTPWKAGGQRVG